MKANRNNVTLSAANMRCYFAALSCVRPSRIVTHRDVAAKMGCHLNNTYLHFKKLIRAGLLKRVPTENSSVLLIPRVKMTVERHK